LGSPGLCVLPCQDPWRSFLMGYSDDKMEPVVTE
jgi:hypothetical protein